MTHLTTVAKNRPRLIAAEVWLPVGLLVAVLLLLLGLALSITLGAAEIDVSTVYTAIFRYDVNSFDHLIIRTVRLPRVVAGVIIGAGLATAGAIMQGLTGNPLASPDLLGINSGAALAVVLGVYLFGGLPFVAYGFLAMTGATVAAVLVYTLAALGRGGLKPVKLTLAGVIMSMLLSAFTTGILVLDRQTFDQIRFWSVGSLAGRDWAMILWLGPLVAAGLVGALLLSRQITTLSLGQELAQGLGQNTLLVKTAGSALVILLAGGSVALAGPVGFVGLIVPHLVRPVCGVDYRWILPYSAVAGAMLVTTADALGRVVQRPQELPVGLMLAFVGAPFFIYLARWRVR